MSWWSGLDEGIYVSIDDVKRRSCAMPEPADEGWPPALRSDRRQAVAVLARQVATPNYEMMHFTRLARRHGFEPLVIEHRTDRFTVHNPVKRALATLPIVVGRSRNGQPILRRQRMVDPSAAEGRRLDEVATNPGESLLAYHHRKLLEVMGPDAPRVIDLTDVVPTCGAGAATYYVEFFSMLRDGLVLLEDFVADDQTASFFQRTVQPAWRQVVRDTGRQPQIARLIPGRRTSSPLWIAYPPAVADDRGWTHPARSAERVAA